MAAMTEAVEDLRMLPGAELPITAPLDAHIQASEVASEMLSLLAKTLEADNCSEDDLATLFIQGALWKDILSFTGQLRTFYSPVNISAKLATSARSRRPHGFELVQLPIMQPRIAELTPQLSSIKAFFTFESREPAATHGGVMSLVFDLDKRWKIWAMTTWMEDLKGLEARNPKTGLLVNPFASSGTPGGNTIKTNGSIDSSTNYSTSQVAKQLQAYVDVLLVGAGHNGLGLAARLAGCDLSYLVVEKNKHIGDNWDLRYDWARYHTPKHFGPLPFSPVRPEQSEFMHKSELAAQLRDYAHEFDLNVSTSTTIVKCDWDNTQHVWKVVLSRPDLQDQWSLSTKHIVMCTGSGSQVPYIPQIPNRDLFKGEAVHSANWDNCSRWKGKNVVIVGTANTAHDVAEDALQYGARSVTMIQRSPTYILPKEYLVEMYQPLYNDRVPIDIADRIAMTTPTAISNILTSKLLHSISARPDESHRFQALAKAGFKVVREGDLLTNLLCRGGGHYIDVGASALICAGKISVKSGIIASFTKEGLQLADGATVPADAIVFATGFSDKDMVPIAGTILGPHNVVGCLPVWGVDAEGEVRGTSDQVSRLTGRFLAETATSGTWRDSGREGLWFMPGAGSSSRFWSRILATQLKAAVCGIDLKPAH